MLKILCKVLTVYTPRLFPEHVGLRAVREHTLISLHLNGLRFNCELLVSLNRAFAAVSHFVSPIRRLKRLNRKSSSTIQNSTPPGLLVGCF